MISCNKLICTTILAGCFAAVLPAADEALPPAEKILDRYIEVTGGKAAHEKVKSAIINTTMTMPAQGMKASITSYVISPNKHYVAVELPGMGTMEEGSDGVVAWSKNAMMGPRLKDGDEKAIAMRSNALDKDVKWREYYSKAETIAAEPVDGKTCYKVVMTPKVGPVETRYFDKDSGLFVKLALTQKTPMGEIPSEMSFSDYKAFEGITGPTKIAVKTGPQEMQMSVDSIQYNADIPADRFKLPADIQALVDKKNGATAKPAAAPATTEKK